MKIHKELIELLGYGQHWNGTTFVPVMIDANDVTCSVKLNLVDEAQEITEVMLQGKHDNFVFTTELNGVAFSINLKTGVMKKVRRHED